MIAENRIAHTGCSSIDKLLVGGFPTKAISLVYGEAYVGKTTLAMQCALAAMKRGFKTIYIDSDNAFSVPRLEQLAILSGPDFLRQFLLTSPKNFREQSETLEEMEKYVAPETSLIVIDTITSLYRMEIGAPSRTFRMNKDLNRQLAHLSKMSKEKDLVVILTSQVHFAFKRGIIEPPASRILNYWSDLIMQLKQAPGMGMREALLKKYCGKFANKVCSYKLTEFGISDV